MREEMTAYVFIHNSDRTEGRGRNVYAGIYESESDAIAAAKGQDVQGSDAQAQPMLVFQDIGLTGSHAWYGPVNIRPASKESKNKDNRLEAQRAARKKAIAAGLTDEDIALL